jgi:hypothetical protein
MTKIACCIFAHEVTKGMKSYGSIGLLKATNKGKELIYHCIKYIKAAIHTKNIFILLGFEEDKLVRKIKEYSLITHDQTITNDYYLEKNQGYAFKLALKKILQSEANINGVLFLNSNSIIKKLPSYSTKESWILIDKKLKNPRYNIGCFIADNMVKHMFYNLGDSYWAEAIYLTMSDIKKIYACLDDLYYDNMFMFEIINTAIERQSINIKALYSLKSTDIVKITGLKDKHKIK